MLLKALKVVRAGLIAAWLLATIGLIGLIALPHALPHFQRELYVVRGSSMEPGVPLGAAVVVRLREPEEVKIGDVITFRSSNGTVVTHRVVGIAETPAGDSGRSFQTKGDASAAADPLVVPTTSLIGEVEYSLPGLGLLLTVLASAMGSLAALGLLGGLLLTVWFIDELTGALRRSSTGRAAVPEPAH